jgi:ribulose-phosphate 3-epimerase
MRGDRLADPPQRAGGREFRIGHGLGRPEGTAPHGQHQDGSAGPATSGWYPRTGRRGSIAAHLDLADVSREPLIAPSLLSADFARLAEETHRVADADWLHVDVMDAHFVPNLTLGLPVVQAIQRVSPVPLDCHLMIDDPERWAPGYAEAGARNVTVHAEACTDPRGVARDLRAAGALAGLAIKPGTPLEDYLDVLRDFDTLLVMSVEPGFGGQSFIADVLPKGREARRLVDSGELTLLVEIDGGINADTIEQAAEAGVDMFVAGSAVYGADDPAKAIAALRARAASAMSG